jgi:hypothetical protein
MKKALMWGIESRLVSFFIVIRYSAYPHICYAPGVDFFRGGRCDSAPDENISASSKKWNLLHRVKDSSKTINCCFLYISN